MIAVNHTTHYHCDGAKYVHDRRISMDVAKLVARCINMALEGREYIVKRSDLCFVFCFCVAVPNVSPT